MEEQSQLRDIDEFEPLTNSLKNMESSYRQFKIHKEKTNRRLKKNYGTQIEWRTIDGRDQLKTEKSEVADLAVLVNELNIKEQEKFQRVNFVKGMKKKLVQMEKDDPANFYSGKIQV